MISREIEKEIRQENKVLLNFTLRQVICVSAALLCSICFTVFLGLEFFEAVYPCLVIGGLCFAFGWWKQDGIPMERILLKKLQVALYQNNIRKFKTRNRYVVLLNEEYERRKQLDLKDKKLKRQIRRETKKAAKQKKQSSLERRKLK